MNHEENPDDAAGPVNRVRGRQPQNGPTAAVRELQVFWPLPGHVI